MNKAKLLLGDAIDEIKIEMNGKTGDELDVLLKMYSNLKKAYNLLMYYEQ